MLKGAVKRMRNTGLTVFVLLAAITIAAAEEKRELLVYYVPSSLLKTNDNPKQPLPVGVVSVVARSATATGRTERWERFEAEFGLGEKRPSMMEGAKYQIDRAVFSVNDFIQHSLNFDYELRNIGRATPVTGAPRRVHNNMLIVSLEGARFKSEVSMDSLLGRGFVGVKLVLPIGD